MEHNYHQRQPSNSSLFASPLPFALAMIGSGAMIFGLWYFFYAGTSNNPNQEVPLIKAEAGPMKVRPDNAAQPEVPHQDKLVYSRVNPAEQGAGVEKLLPPTEEPIDMAEQTSELPTNDGFPNPKLAMEDKSNFRTDPDENKLEVAENTAPAIEAEKMELTQATVPEPVKETTVTAQQIAEAAVEEKVEKPVIQETKKAKTLQSGYRVQLAAMKSQDQAKKEWGRLQGEFKTALTGLQPNYTKVDLGAKKGIFYRVQAGDFANKTEAQNVCSKLKSQNPNAGCMIVKF